MKKFVLGTLAATLLAASALPALARTNVDFYVNVAPPPLRYEVVPAPRVGYVWVPGYWDWRASRYYWVRGSWSRPHAGRYYEPVRWVHRDGRYYRNGGWRDSDGDGVPNRYDHAPHNPRWR